MEESKKENTCSVRRCKKFELSPVVCKACKQTFCMQHRLEMDHNCPGKPVSQQKASAPKRSKPKKASGTQAQLDEVSQDSSSSKDGLYEASVLTVAVSPGEGSTTRGKAVTASSKRCPTAA